tara:strand:+ start:132 stop:959 length:828 start_codon:yes stop_codon:yes gene_type:complete
MKIFYSIDEFINNQLQIEYFIPTMGNLHDGHLSLIKEAKNSSSGTCVSIYVNESQFSNQDDFKNYPKTLNDDIQKLNNLNVDYLLIPEKNDIQKHSQSFDISKEPKNITSELCGKYRKGHFLAVMDIVHRLFQIVKPRNAIFGDKDYQQFVVIQELIKIYNYKINLIRSPIVRNDEGLALSSRNNHLSDDEIKYASEIYKSLKYAKNLYNQREKIEEITKQIYKYFDNFPIKIEYFSIRDLKTLQPRYDDDLIALIAVHLGKVRLIDNIIIKSTS